MPSIDQNLAHMAATLVSRATTSPPAMMAAVPPPPGVTQNFINPPETATNAPILVGIGITFAGLFLLMRLYTKGYLLRKLGLEDLSIFLAFLFTIATCTLILVGRKFGTGKHIWDVPITDLPNWGKVVTAAVVLYCPSMMFAKLAVLICYLRISPQKAFRISVYITMGLVLAYNIALMLVLIFACHPIAKAWDATITKGSCVNRPAVYLANGAINVFTDFLILLLPVPMIRGLQMPLRQKLLLAAIFSVGSLACIVSIVRLRTLVPALGDPDQTWAIADPGNWIVIETTLAVSCGCLSVIRPFLRHHLPRLLPESRAASNRLYGQSSTYGTKSRRNPGASVESKSRMSRSGNNLGHVGHPWNKSRYSQDKDITGKYTDSLDYQTLTETEKSSPFEPTIELDESPSSQERNRDRDRSRDHTSSSPPYSHNYHHPHKTPTPPKKASSMDRPTNDSRFDTHPGQILKTTEVNIHR